MIWLALLYFAVATVWLLRQREWKKAVLTLVIVTLFLAFLFVAANVEWIDGELKWNAPQP